MSRRTYAADAAYLPPMAGPIDEGERLHELMKASGVDMTAAPVAGLQYDG